MSSSIPGIRKFAGKTYIFERLHTSEAKAKDHLHDLRYWGSRPARMVKITAGKRTIGYAVYARSKNGRSQKRITAGKKKSLRDNVKNNGGFI